ncbi:unnamed protein product [Durusdinium trenchii]|uniref:Transmembrane protein 144 n=1 Tax=Durusdinium trenchii TaxID=1381693 RepID=A0ABP0RRU6_9DINO
MSQAVGLIYAFVAAIAFGIQYVPVKKYEIFEGTAFQWFMCNGILMCGFIIAAASGELQRGLSPLVMLGGVFWASSNYLVLPLVKLLGIGLGFSLYHFVNLMTGYCIGRFGLFGVKVLTGKLLYCDIGCFLILISFFAMVFVEAGHENGEVSDSDSECSSDESGSYDKVVKATGTMAKAEELGTLDRLGPGAQKVLGVVLAILAGVLCGVNGVPATLWEAQHPEADAFSVALPQCLGIWVCSSGEAQEVGDWPGLRQWLHLGHRLCMHDEGYCQFGLLGGLHLGCRWANFGVQLAVGLRVQGNNQPEAAHDLLWCLYVAAGGSSADWNLW